MGRGVVKAQFAEIVALTNEWADGHSLSFTKSPSPKYQPSDKENSVHYQAKGLFRLVTWQFCTEGSDTTVDIAVSLRPWLNFLLYGILLSGLGFLICILPGILIEFTLERAAIFIIPAIFILLFLHWKDSIVSHKLSRFEGTFWEKARFQYDIHQLTRAGTRTYSKRFRLCKELLLSVWAILICWCFLGYLGAIIALFLCVPILIMIIVDLTRGEIPNWHWRLWIIGNMARWTFLMMAILAFVPILGSFEVFMNYEMPRDENNIKSMGKAIKEMRLRGISPYAIYLESDIRNRLQELSRPKDMSDEEWNKIAGDCLYTNSILVFVIFFIALYFFVLRYFNKLIRSQKEWASEVGDNATGSRPFVPYYPEASKWRIPELFWAVIIIHYVLGGIIHLAATVFCVEGFCYAFIGKTVLFGQLANLWSWLFAVCKILFGNTAGWIVGLLFLSGISLPILVTIGAYVRRFLASFALTIQVLFSQLIRKKRDCQHVSQIEEFAGKACRQFNLKKPMVWITSEKAVIVRLHWLPALTNCVIEISQGTVDLLGTEELQAVIAHEIGHIKQGIWKIAFLKMLSSLAIFPNHYLSLCLNWAAMEMNADSVALTLTGNPKPLKQALVKISMAQTGYLKQHLSKQPTTSTASGIGHWVKNTFRIKYSAIRFFFGDALFGYTHPYLSERLKA